MKPATPRTDSLYFLASIGKAKANDLGILCRELETIVEADTALIAELRKDRAQLVAALRSAIAEADGCHDDEHGTPSPNLDAERALLLSLEEDA